MAVRIRAFDWSATPLGPLGLWPQSLRTAVDIMLASGHAMQLAWGPRRTVLYNDAYAPMLGGRHPRVLGLPFPQAWPDVWTEIGPLVERVFAGETVTFEDLPLVTTRHGYPEDTWWSFSYSPVRDEAGAVAGLLNVAVDATGRIRAERAEAALRDSEERQLFLLKLSDALRSLADAADIQQTAVTLMGERLGVDRALYAEFLDEGGRAFVLVEGEYLRPGVASFAGRRPAERFEPDLTALRAGRTVAVADAEAEPTGEAGGRVWRDLQTRARLGAPLIKGGHLVAGIAVHVRAAREWTGAEAALVAEVGERTWAAVERARAEAALRDSEQRFRALATTGAPSIYRMSPDWRLMYQLDSQTLANTSEPIEDWVGKYILPEDLPTVRAAIGKAIGARSLFELEHRVRLADGVIGWVVSRAVPLLG
ncbi:MAG: PAS domain-containing protein, partial [Caulobacteraceae bacterium]|nr:PAS domain-containing protein [Caulobacter sp.]